MGGPGAAGWVPARSPGPTPAVVRLRADPAGARGRRQRRTTFDSTVLVIAAVPPGAGTVGVTVTTPGGTSDPVSHTQVPPPRI